MFEEITQRIENMMWGSRTEERTAEEELTMRMFGRLYGNYYVISFRMIC